MPYIHIALAIFGVAFFAHGARVEEEPPVLWGMLSGGASLLVILTGGGLFSLFGGQVFVYGLLFIRKMLKERKREGPRR